MLNSLITDQLCCRGVAEIPSAAAGAAAEEATVCLLPGEDGHQRQEHDQAGHRMQGEGISSHETFFTIPFYSCHSHVFRLTRTKLR